MKLQKDIGDKIRQLKAQGKRVKEIIDEVGCSKQIVYYHLSDDYRDKVKALLKKHRLKEEVLYKKRLRQKYENFFNIGRKGNMKPTFTFEDFLTKLMADPKCYLTGRDLNISDTSSFSPDHIVSIAKGGTSDLSNLGFVCREANMAKSDLSLDDFIQLCKEVTRNFEGY
jgi:hypothetical protein